MNANSVFQGQQGANRIRRHMLLTGYPRLVCIWLAMCVYGGLERPTLAQAAVDSAANHAPASTLTQAAQPVLIDQGTEVVKRWDSQQHLYVKGNVGVGREQLNQLEAWLDAHATNWIVVLLEHAEGERFTDTSGQTYSGLDAVEHALGKGLANQTGFGQLRDARTQEANGAFFILFLKERKLSYYGSTAQNRRGLSKDSWAGNLDQPAISAMRNGGRIVDAVRDTISNINRRLDAALVAEKTARERQAAAEAAAREQRLLAAKAAREQAQAGLHSATEALGLLENQVHTWRGEHPNLTGDLARPDLTGLRAELKTAESALAAGNTAAVTAAAASVKAKVNTHLQALADYQSAPGKFQDLESRFQQQTNRAQAKAAFPELQKVRDLLNQGRSAYARGDSSYVMSLDTARPALGAVEKMITAAEQTVRYRQRLQMGGGAAALLLLATLGLALNWRRRGPKAQCHELLQAWERGLGEKNLALFALLDRVSSLLGTSPEDTARRYAGQTRQLGEQIIKDVDESYIMSACAGRVFNSAQALAQPTQAWPRLANFFSARRYLQATRVLRDEPIEFKPEEGLELVVRGSKSDRERLIGNLADYQPFTMSFTQLIEAFNEKAGRALTGLDTVESSLISVGATLEKLQAALEELRRQEPALEQASQSDGLFRLPGVFTTLIPAAQAAQAEGIKNAVADAVSAVQVNAPAVQQKVDDAWGLIRLAGEFRQVYLPQMNSGTETLKAQGLSVQWIEAAIHQASEAADNLAQQAVNRSAAQEISALKQTLEQLGGRIERAVELDRVRREVAQKALEENHHLIEATRRELGASLQLAPDQVLREQDLNPSDRLQQATEQIASARAALDRGDVAAAQSALDTVIQLAQEAARIVAETQKAFAEQDRLLADCRQENEQIKGALPEHEQILERLDRQYLDTVMLLGAGDLAHPNANGTVRDNLEEVSTHLRAAQEAMDLAVSLFQKAGILHANALLRQAQSHQETARYRLREITDKQERLALAEAANATLLAQVITRRDELAGAVNEMTTRQPTVDVYQAARQEVAQAQALVEASRCDPFQAAQGLAKAQQTLEQVADQVRCDRDLFAQAERELRSATAQWQAGQNLARQAAADQVTDSPAILNARSRLEQLEADLARVQACLQFAHGDWEAASKEADRVAAEASRQASILKGELQQAETAVSALLSAASAVRAAGGWTGMFGVRILGCPGDDVLAQARARLQSGDYASSRSLAETARRVAVQAVAEAEARVHRIRQEQAEAQERERRRRQQEEQARQRHHTLSRSSWGSGHSGVGRSSFSRGSGVGRSSFSRGSGVGRSGW